jgi:hypothetical protein
MTNLRDPGTPARSILGPVRQYTPPAFAVIASQLVLAAGCVVEGGNAQQVKARVSDSLYFYDLMTLVLNGVAVVVVLALLLWLWRTGALMALLNVAAVALAALTLNPLVTRSADDADDVRRLVLWVGLGIAGVVGMWGAARRPRGVGSMRPVR